MAGISKLASDFLRARVPQAVLLRWHSSRAQLAFTQRGRKFCALAQWARRSGAWLRAERLSDQSQARTGLCLPLDLSCSTSVSMHAR